MNTLGLFGEILALVALGLFGIILILFALALYLVLFALSPEFKPQLGHILLKIRTNVSY